MMHLKDISVDENGYLINRNDWTPEIAIELAKIENIELSKTHHEIINFLREYYEEFQVAPAVRVLIKAVGKQLGNAKGNSAYMYDLFPGGPGKQACKIAGLPKPAACG